MAARARSILKRAIIHLVVGSAGPNYQNYAVEANEFFKAQQGAFLQKGSAGWFQWVRLSALCRPGKAVPSLKACLSLPS